MIDRIPIRLSRACTAAVLAAALAAGCSDAPDTPAAPIAAAPSPAECYTGPEDQPAHPRGVNRYAVALLDDPGGHAGALDEYAHCQYLPAELPPAADPR